MTLNTSASDASLRKMSAQTWVAVEIIRQAAFYCLRSRNDFVHELLKKIAQTPDP
jgi:hypothetical protein